MAEHGGYRQPKNPAPVSLPGKLSRRTDGGPAHQVKSAPTGMDYGAHRALMATESVAPMAGTPAVPTPSINVPDQSAGPAPQPPFPPFLRPSERPNEPITHGVDIGPGGGSEVLPVETQPGFGQQGSMTQMLSQFAARDMTGAMARLLQSARDLGA